MESVKLGQRLALVQGERINRKATGEWGEWMEEEEGGT